MRRSKNIPLSFDDVDDDTETALPGGGDDESPEAWLSELPGAASAYDRDWSEGQPLNVVVLTEGAGKVRQFSTVAEDYGVSVRSGGGWESVDYKHALARAACREYFSDGSQRPTVYLHCGDFDADGVALYESGVEDVLAFVSGMIPDGYDAHEIVSFERVMLTEDQILEHVPDQNLDFLDRSKIKAKDHRGRRWYGDQAARGLRPFKCELEALSLETRLEIVREAIERYVDLDQLQRVKDRAERERTMLGEVIGGHVDDMVADARERAPELDRELDHGQAATVREQAEPSGAEASVEPEPAPLEADEGVIPADFVDHMKDVLEMHVTDRILAVGASGPQLTELTEEMQKRIARRWLRHL